MGINDCTKTSAAPLTAGCLGEQIGILAEKDSAERSSTIEQSWIVESGSASSCAVNTSTPRKTNALVIAAGTCTSI